MILKQIWPMIRKEIKLAAQQRGQWLLVFLTPIVFIAVLGSVFGAGGAPTVAVYLVNEDEGRQGRQIVDLLEDEKTLAVELLASRAEADARVGRGERMAAIVVPVGFSAAVLTDAGGKIEVIVDPARAQSAGMVVGQVQAATAPLLIDAEVTRGVRTAFNTAPEQLGIDVAALEEAGIDLEMVEKFLAAALKGVVSSQVQDTLDDPLVRLDVQPAAKTERPVSSPTIYDYLVPAYSVFFAFFLMGLMAETVLNERVSGTLRRLFSVPLSKGGFMVGKALPYGLIAMLQMVVVMGVSSVLFQYDVAGSPLALVLLVVVFGLTVGCFGMMVAVLVRTEGQASAIPSLLTLVMAAVSGAMFPTIRIPGLQELTPQYWAIDGFVKVTALHADVAGVAQNIGVLLAMAIVTFAVGLWRFRY